MALIRLQNNVPEPYIRQSRDFQLLSRAYDCIINGVKFDIDTIDTLTNTAQCSTRVLQLLQTKLGFFSNENITDDELRYVLQAFPTIMKNKGSLLAIKQAVRVYLKLMKLDIDVNITVTGKNDIEPYTVKIGLRTGFTDTTVLDEILKYILPTGYEFTYVFYTSISNKDEEGNVRDPMKLKSSVTAIYVSDERNSEVRGSSYTDATQERLLGAVDTVEVISSDSEGNTLLEEKTYTEVQ